MKMLILLLLVLVMAGCASMDKKISNECPKAVIEVR